MLIRRRDCETSLLPLALWRQVQQGHERNRRLCAAASLAVLHQPRRHAQQQGPEDGCHMQRKLGLQQQRLYCGQALPWWRSLQRAKERQCKVCRCGVGRRPPSPRSAIAVAKRPFQASQASYTPRWAAPPAAPAPRRLLAACEMRPESRRCWERSWYTLLLYIKVSAVVGEALRAACMHCS